MHFKITKFIKSTISAVTNVILLLAVLFTSQYSVGQTTKKDSLLHVIELERNGINFNSKDTVYINNLIELASIQRYFNLDSLYILSKEGIDLSQKADFKKGQIKSILNLAGYYSDKGKITEALPHLKKAYKIADQHQELQLKVRVLNALSTEYCYQGNNAEALKGYLQAIEIAEKFNYLSWLSIVNENIAQLYVSQKDYDHAMVFFHKVKLINEKIGNPIYIAETMSNMATAYADMNELEYAMFHINSSIATFEKEKILEWLAHCYEIKGKIYRKKNKLNWALYWYKQSEMLHEKVEDDRGEISLLNGMAEAYLNLNNDSIAEVYALKGYDISKKIEYNIGIQECSNLLYKINKLNNNFETALGFHEIFQATSDSLAKGDNVKSLNMLKTKMEYDLQKKELILQNEKALANQKAFLYVFLVIILIFSVITIIIKRNAKIQKNLNDELLSKKKDLEEKQVYLNELNQTKNRLFSIIGHDLRGPIGAFQGLLKLFKQGEMTNEEFLNFVPKLKVDIDTISFTLNNLLSWGQTQMNGSTTKPTVVKLDHIVEENVALLSETADSKAITLINKIEPDCQIWADSNQIDIIIRNLLSNALKFTPNNGQIVIGAIKKLKTCEIYVQDNGLGMSEDTIGKIFQKDSNHTTYGTNDEKGTGLGLALCKEMVEKNQGKIWVNSVLGRGSSFYFTTLRVTEQFKKSA